MKSAENKKHYTRTWIESKKQFMLGQLKSWCDEEVFAEFEKQYFDDITGLYKGLRHIGAPEKQSAGYWNTTCLCCGTAGILQFLINYSLITNSEESREVTKTAVDILLGEQLKQEKGIAAALAQTYLFFEGKFEWDRLYDDPYPQIA